MSTDEDQDVIEAHNARELWRDAANHLEVAKQSLETAQGVLEDLGVQQISGNLTPTIGAVERFRQLAADNVLGVEKIIERLRSS